MITLILQKIQTFQAALDNSFLGRFWRRPISKKEFNFLVFLCVITLIVVNTSVQADDISPANTVFDDLKGNIIKVYGRLESMSYRLLGALVTLQFIITIYGEFSKGDGGGDVMVMKAAKAILWLTFCMWLLSDYHAAVFIRNSVQYFLENAIGFATGSKEPLNIEGVISKGWDGVTSIMKAFWAAEANSFGLWKAITGAMGAQVIVDGILVLISVCIVVVITFLMALKVFMVNIEALLIVMLLPISIALMGLNALRDQGFAPFKGMLALIYRILIMGVIVGGLSEVSKTILDYINKVALAPGAHTNFGLMMLAMMFGYVMLGYLAIKSDQIASMLASGQSSLGSNADAGMAAGGMMAAATMMAGAAAVMAGAAKGGGASIANAGAAGTGGQGAAATPGAAPSKPSASVGGGSSSSSGSGQPPSPPPLPSSSSGGDATSSGGSESSSSGGQAEAGNAMDAGIGNTAPPISTGGAGSNTSSSSGAAPEKKGFLQKSLMDHAKDYGKHAGEVNDSLKRDSHSTSVSINTHHD